MNGNLIPSQNTLFQKIRDYLDVVPGAIKNHLNTEELLRVTVTSMTAGAGLFGLIEAVSLSLGAIFPCASDAALAASLLTFILGVRKRLNQGEEPPRASRPVCGGR